MRRGARGLVVGLMAVALASGAGAQGYSKGYKFLESIRNNEMSEVANTLAESGTTPINTRDSVSGETGLHILVMRRDAPWVRYFIAKGADPNIRNSKGETPLVIAANIGFTEGVEALIEGGARVDEANSTGETPLMSAVHRRDLPMLRVLLRAGANPDRADSAGRSARDYAQVEDRSGIIINEINNAKKGGAGARSSYGPSL